MGSSSRAGLYVTSGVFVLVGMAVLLGVLFTIGSERSIFDDSYRLMVRFKDIGGLSVSAPVRLAGVDVGRVEAIEFPSDLSDKQIRVRLAVKRRVGERIRADSVATIGSRGLLGDKVIDITIGSAGSEPLADGADIRAEDPPNFFQFYEKIQKVVDKGSDIASHVEQLTGSLAEEGTRTALQESISSVRNMVKAADEGKGLLHDLIHDRRIPDLVRADLQEARKTLVEARGAIETLRGTATKVDEIVAQVRRGPGTVHDLLYDPKGAQMVENLQESVRELGVVAADVGQIVRAVKEEKGVLHSLIYEQDAQNFIDDLNAVAASLRRVSDEIEAGRGTVGGLVKDPTIYEDLRQILGEIKRNKVLKALVRYAADVEDGAGDARRVKAGDQKKAP